MRRRGLTLCALVLVFCCGVGGLAWLGAWHNEQRISAVPINGDSLGPDTGESWGAYAARAAATVADAQGSTEPRFALVLFDDGEHGTIGQGGVDTWDTVAHAVEDAGIERVNALVVADHAAWGIPEPARGESRAEVFQRESTRVSAVMGKTAVACGVVVYATPHTLAVLAENPIIRSVEELPPDAVWGRFGVRTPTVQSSGSCVFVGTEYEVLESSSL